MTETIRTARLVLTPLQPKHASEMIDVLSDPALYTFTGGEPPTLDRLEKRYRAQSSGSPGDDETWHNWILHLDRVAIGFVQATARGGNAELAWLLGRPWQGIGYATEASAAMRAWLVEQGVVHFSAHIHPDHSASNAVATRIGLRPTGQLDPEGEMIWASM